MDLVTMVTLVTMGVLMGVVATDFTHRFLLTKQMQKAKTDLEQTAEKLAKEHNNMASQVMILQEAVNSHEFKLSGRSLTGLPNEVKT